MIKILNGIYTAKVYQGPVCIVEDIFHLEIVIEVDTIFKKERLEKRIKLTNYLKKYSFMDLLLKILQVNSQSYDS